MDKRSLHKKLWEHLRAGNEQGLYDLYRELYHSLFFTGMKICRDGMLVRDCINQTFLYFWEKHATLGVAENVSSYVNTSFRRRLVAELQLQQKYNRRLEDAAGLEEQVTPSHEEYLIEIQNGNEMRKRMRTAISKLSKRKQELVNLHYYEGLSYEEIAEKTGLSIRTIYNKVHEAIKTLKQELDHSGGNSSLPIGIILMLCLS